MKMIEAVLVINLFVLRNVWDNMDELDEDWDFETYMSDDTD